MSPVFKFISLSAMLVLLLGFVAVTSANTQAFAPAAACHFLSFINWDSGIWGTYGEFRNGDDVASAEVTCGFGQDQALDTNDDVRVYYDDNNDGSQPDDNIWCYASEVDNSWGTLTTSADRYGCSTTGGCTTSPGIFAAAGRIEFADISHGGDMFSTVVCWVPHRDAASSVIQSLYLIEQ